MSLFFQTRKYGTVMDISFAVHDGPDPSDLRRFTAGDDVTLIFPVKEVMAQAIKSCLPMRDECAQVHSDGLSALGGNRTPDYFVWLTFTMLKARHHLSLDTRYPYILRESGREIVLQADSGQVEDVLLLICGHEKPQWYLDYLEDQKDQAEGPKSL